MTQSTCLLSIIFLPLDHCILSDGFQGTPNVSMSGLSDEEVLSLGDMWKARTRSGQKGMVFQENIIEMNNGCICCTVRGDLIAGLKKMATAPVDCPFDGGHAWRIPRTPEAGNNMKQ